MTGSGHDELEGRRGEKELREEGKWVKRRERLVHRLNQNSVVMGINLRMALSCD